MRVWKITITPFVKCKLCSNISFSRRYSDRIILWHYSFGTFTIACLRRFLDDKLDLCGTDCYFSPNECFQLASSFWSPFSFPRPLSRYRMKRMESFQIRLQHVLGHLKRFWSFFIQNRGADISWCERETGKKTQSGGTYRRSISQ